MTGTKSGGLKAAATNKMRHGEGFYAKIGAKGGRNGNTGGFAANRELARAAGAKGGRISRRSDGREWWAGHRDEISAMREKGYTLQQIGEKLGKSRSEMAYLSSKYGE